MDIDPERIARSPFMIGALGSLVALRFVPGEGWREKVFNVLCGTLTAGYVAPALVEWLKLQTPGLVNASAFVLGLLGMSLVAAIVQGIKALSLGEIANDWLKRRG